MQISDASKFLENRCFVSGGKRYETTSCCSTEDSDTGQERDKLAMLRDTSLVSWNQGQGLRR
ncbi:hypothetical protein MPTK1_1g08120 [Marchantia polymorpha subsp. ruderalis]|uniref:Uncharacterized protein n=2 Tax=Marchantia polymorpha TaxID=3197 RepID=A0AAF6AMU3_MARPO|nr:hypothetical protein MARPO_0036s0056 [Marchantia polymorpha]BBM97763.1 hypothetical protein Mp_1g08120 [Marchantia polymorpha subsp. ruderalis]|eukprot:PTQ41066.1 hypothetical protein MARPO_0036s0056 [Marchantia polymorpha]